MNAETFKGTHENLGDFRCPPHLLPSSFLTPTSLRPSALNFCGSAFSLLHSYFPGGVSNCTNQDKHRYRCDCQNGNFRKIFPGPTNPIRSPRLTSSDTSSKSARPAKDFESCERVSIAESAQCCLVRCPAQLVSRDQTSLYSKIDIFFPIHGKGDYVG